MPSHATRIGAMAARALRGAVAFCGPSFGDGAVVLAPDALLAVSAGGALVAAVRDAGGAEGEALLRSLEAGGVPVTCLPRGSVLLPGLVDTHLHAPQFSFTGTRTDTELMRWLDETTFPAESAMASEAAASEVFGRLVSRLLSLGTTAALYFSSVHVRAAVLLAEQCARQGQRAIVGKVSMDRNAPDGTVERDAEEAVRAAAEAARGIRSIGSNLVEPAVTPRFVPTCSPELLEGLGRLAREEGLLVQSHISESDGECAFVAALHPEEPRDTDLLDRAGLLTSRSVMAHGVKLTATELAVLARRGASLAHCPLSNFYFANGSLRAKRALKAGVKMGLGTDIAGGISPSMLVAARSAVVASRAVMHAESERLQREEGCSAEEANNRAEASEALTWRDALWLATAGGADALGLNTGHFREGEAFDALLVDLTGAGVYDVFPSSDSSLDDSVERFFNLGDDRNIRAVVVQGAVVRGSLG